MVENSKIKMQKSKLSTDKIPLPKRDAGLVIRLKSITLFGFDNVLDKNGQLYLRLLCRLVDKAFYDYLSASEYLLEELKTKNKLAYRFSIIDHLENCINALGRAISVFNCSKGRSSIGHLISRDTKRKIERLSVSEIRNDIEHIDKDIQKGLWQKGLFLDVDEEYKNICINNHCIALTDLVYALEQYHQLVLEIFKGLPNRQEGGKYYYDKKQI